MTTTTFMNAIRRRLASGALALTVLQFTLLFAAPVSACCENGAPRVTAAASASNEIECCPPGSHPPGQCPLHKNKDKNGASSSSSSRAMACRMMCDSPHGPKFLLGLAGVIAAPQSTAIDLTEYTLDAGAPFAATARPALPDAPPPRLL
jgi:hypothetical protein